MRYEYINKFPVEKLIDEIKNKSVEELWIAFAYFSSNLVLKIIEKINIYNNEIPIHIIFSTSSINPFQDIVDEILILTSKHPLIKLHLVENPLMHSKLFASKKSSEITIYLGSANLTNKAYKSNIETGVIINFKKKRKTIKYLENFVNLCKNDNSLKLLKNKSIFSHFRSELLFLALDDSKTRKSITLSPYSLKGILSSKVDRNQDDKTVNIKTQQTFTIFVLNENDRNKLLSAEKNLREAIKKYSSIKVEGYGWVSSRWALDNILQKDHEINKKIKKYKNILVKIKNNYNKISYRLSISQEIEDGILSWINEQGVHMTEELQESISSFLSLFRLNVTNKKSPYRKLENLYNSTNHSSGLISLLNPFVIGEDNNVDDGLEILSTDQVNLVVMCLLAKKIRSSKPPKVPAVWWFDIALDSGIYDILGYKNISSYKQETSKELDVIISNTYDDPSNIDKYLDAFCKITGFNLGVKYPKVNELYAWIDDGETIDNEPYVFISSEKARHNIVVKEKLFMFAIDKEKAPDWECNDEDLEKIKGEFILGENLCLHTDEDSNYFTCLYLHNS